MRMLLQACPTDDACMNDNTGVVKASSREPPYLLLDSYRLGIAMVVKPLSPLRPSVRIDMKMLYIRCDQSTGLKKPSRDSQFEKLWHRS